VLTYIARETKEGFKPVQGYLYEGANMLVLSRKLGEQIVIPYCEMTVTVVAIEGNNVRLGFTAPREVHVYRREVRDKMIEADGCLSTTAARPLRRIHS
jgi:carbon storage regulator